MHALWTVVGHAAHAMQTRTERADGTRTRHALVFAYSRFRRIHGWVQSRMQSRNRPGRTAWWCTVHTKRPGLQMERGSIQCTLEEGHAREPSRTSADSVNGPSQTRLHVRRRPGRSVAPSRLTHVRGPAAEGPVNHATADQLQSSIRACAHATAGDMQTASRTCICRHQAATPTHRISMCARLADIQANVRPLSGQRIRTTQPTKLHCFVHVHANVGECNSVRTVQV